MSSLAAASAYGIGEIPDSAVKAAESWTYAVKWENDIWGGTDRYYTNGAYMIGISPDARAWDDDGEVSGFTKWLIENGPFSERPDTLYRYSLAIAQDIFTDRNIEDGPANPNERPYAGWLHLDGAFRAVNANRMDVVEISLGVVGPWSGAEEIQQAIHQVIASPDPQGWDEQLRNEPSIQLSWNRFWHAREDFTSEFSMDITPMAGVTVGNVHIYGQGGVHMRLGWNLPYDYGQSRIMPAGAHAAPYDDLDVRLGNSEDWSFFFITGFDTRAIARNIFLDGSTYRDSRSVDRELFVTDAQAGIAFSLDRLTVTLVETFRSSEFKEENEWQIYGQMTINYLF